MSVALTLHAGPPPAVNVAFVVVFGAFAVAFVVLTVITLTWAVRRDRAGRAQWVSRRLEEQQQEEALERGPGAGPPVTNGRHPAPGRRGGTGSRS